MTLHTRPATNLARLGLTLLMMAGLTACGGGGGSGGTLTGEEVARELFTQDGVYRIEWKSNIVDAPFTVSRNGISVDGTVTRKTNSRTVSKLDYVSDSEITVINCNDYDDPYYYSTSLDDLIRTEYLEGSFSESGVCPSESSRYTKLGEGRYQIDVMCNGEVWETGLVTRLRTSLEFDEGRLVMQAENYPDLNVTSGVCGDLYDNEESYSYPQPNDLNLQGGPLNEFILEVGTDYQGNTLSFSLSFARAPSAGNYTVTTTYDMGVDEVGVYLSSRSFDPTLAYSTTIEAISGSIVITEITQLTARGTYDLQTEQGAFSGEFSIDLN